MRPQQNRRMRGRGSGSGSGNNSNSNRKGPNPLTRSYESNGPDVKIRGTAQQVAEKYTTLARDSQSSGDRVMAENYLQHAEHYNRLIAAAQQAQAQTQQARSRDDEYEDRDGQDSGSDDSQRSDNDSPRADNYGNGGDGSGPQPVIEGTPAEVAHEQGDFGRGNRARPSDGNRMNGDGEHAEQSADAEQGEQPPRRARRPRRPRAKSGEGESANPEGTAEGEMAEAAADS